MRTSYIQYVMMVEFMEANGDLSKPSGGPRGRHYIQMKWRELKTKLNSDGTGDPRSEEKWRKVWSDYKNNCKKKCAKINRAACGTGGGPALKLSLTDLENRVMQIIGVQAAHGMVVEEAGFQTDKVSEKETEADPKDSPKINYELFDWNTEGTSQPPAVALNCNITLPPIESYTPLSPAALPPPLNEFTEAHPLSPPVGPVDKEWTPPPQKKKKYMEAFIEADRKARQYARERDRAYDELERERLRLRNEELRVKEFEIKERVRQRDAELQMQTKWLGFMEECMNVFNKYMEKK